MKSPHPDTEAEAVDARGGGSAPPRADDRISGLLKGDGRFGARMRAAFREIHSPETPSRGSHDGSGDTRHILKGPDWIHSRERRRHDLRIIAATTPVTGTALLLSATALKLKGNVESVFYSQERIGYRGERFVIPKLRTLSGNPKPGPSLGPEDPRASPVARRIRKYSIDEYPQFLTMLRGEMSLVGVRPLLEGDIERMRQALGPELFERWYHAYCDSVPGLYGLFGLIHSSLESQSPGYYYTRASMDIWQYENASRELDNLILREFIDVYRRRRPDPAQSIAFSLVPPLVCR
ncbi:UNVERIFIED_ORG: lipopolysaccharide/colanic/teichoic acid biosynthesis glycosyltransferase [Burkholderia sp. 1263]